MHLELVQLTTIISLGRADVFNVVAVFDSEEASTDAVAPELTLTNAVGTFDRGEEIAGANKWRNCKNY